MQLTIEKNQKELKEHGNYGFPVCVSEESITLYEGSSFLWHWHPEIEFTIILNGKMEYCINEQQHILNTGDGLFGNANTLHSGYMLDHNSCDYISITFHPRFIYGYENSLLQTKYVDFILRNAEWSSLKLAPAIDWQQEIIKDLQHMYALAKRPSDDFELTFHLILSRIWKRLYRYYSALPTTSVKNGDQWHRLKHILSFIQEHYMEPVTLDDIASSINICKSECCRFFKKHMNMTLFDYLLFFRVQQSLPLLLHGDSIVSIAGRSGFSDPCYYGKIFKRYMHCSPTQYRRLHLPESIDTINKQ